jgi:hypothetical protein
MPIHLIYGAAVAVGKGVLAAGHALGHALAANSAPEIAVAKGVTTHATGTLIAGGVLAGGSILAVAYLDHSKAVELVPPSPDSVQVKTVKFSIAGKLANGEFTTITGPLEPRRDVIMLGRVNEATQEIVSQRFVKADRVEPRLANAYAQGQLVLLG